MTIDFFIKNDPFVRACPARIYFVSHLLNEFWETNAVSKI
jgi:hypothetical protein